MTISSLKELTKVIQACRKMGVQSIKIDNVEFHLGEKPQPIRRQSKASKVQIDTTSSSVYVPGGIDENTKIIAESAAIDTDSLTQDQLLFYSARPEAFEQQEQQ